MGWNVKFCVNCDTDTDFWFEVLRDSLWFANPEYWVQFIALFASTVPGLWDILCADFCCLRWDRLWENDPSATVYSGGGHQGRLVPWIDFFFYFFPSWDQTRTSLEINDGGRQVKLFKLELARDRGTALQVRQREVWWLNREAWLCKLCLWSIMFHICMDPYGI